MALLQHRKGGTVQRSIVLMEEYGLLPILVLSALVRLYSVTQATIWYDEGFSAIVSARSLDRILFHAAHDVHPPLYYLLLHGWMAIFGNGVFALRSMSVLAGVVTVALGVWLMRLIATRRAALLAGILLALLPIAVRYSQEVRMYALVSAWLMGATIALVYWVKKPQRYRYLVIYALLITAGCYTHYLAVLCLFSHWLYLFFLRLQRSVGAHLITQPGWWIANSAIVFLYMPWIPELVGQLSLTAAISWIPSVTLHTLPSVVWQFLTLSDGLELPVTIYMAMPLLVVSVAGWMALRDQAPHKFSVLISLYTFVPILVVFFISLKFPFFVARYFLFASMGIPLMSAIALDQLAQRYRGFALLCLVLLVGVDGVGLYNTYAQKNRLNDPRVQLNNQVAGNADYINQHFVFGDRIVVYGFYWYLSVVYYNQTTTQPLLYTPPSATGVSSRPDAYGAGTLFYQDRDTSYLDSLESLPLDTKRVWLLSGNTPEGYVRVPDDWQPVSTMMAGDTQVRLYALCSLRPCPGR